MNTLDHFEWSLDVKLREEIYIFPSEILDAIKTYKTDIGSDAWVERYYDRENNSLSMLPAKYHKAANTCPFVSTAYCLLSLERKEEISKIDEFFNVLCIKYNNSNRVNSDWLFIGRQMDIEHYNEILTHFGLKVYFYNNITNKLYIIGDLSSKVVSTGFIYYSYCEKGLSGHYKFIEATLSTPETFIEVDEEYERECAELKRLYIQELEQLELERLRLEDEAIKEALRVSLLEINSVERKPLNRRARMRLREAQQKK